MDTSLLEKLSDLLKRRFGLVHEVLQDGLARAVHLRSRERRMAPEEVVASLLGAGPGEEAELGLLVHHLMLGHTRFYRHESVWEELARRLPEAFPAGPVLALVAGCSSGEEAWTVAFLLASLYGETRFSVTALDLSPIAIDIARRADYPADETDRLPAEWRRRYLVEGGEGRRTIAPQLRERVSFQLGNVTRSIPPGPFHVVLCRNVLTYLERSVAVDVVRALGRCVAAGGCLVLASQELPLAETAWSGGEVSWRPTVNGLPVLQARPVRLPAGLDRPVVPSAAACPGQGAVQRAERVEPNRERSGGRTNAHPLGGAAEAGPGGVGDFAVRAGQHCVVRLAADLVSLDASEWVACEHELLEILRVPPQLLTLEIKAVKAIDFRVKRKLARALRLLRSAGTEVRVDGDASLLPGWGHE